MLRKLILVFFVFIVCQTHAQLKWPAITKTTKPWTRWWWEGSAVNEKDLTWNLEQYQKAGLGGVEITPIYGIHGYEKEFINFLSPRWMQVFQHTLNESKRLGIGVDLANATGWPFGGPWVKDEDASKSVYYKTYSLNGGESLQQPVEYMQEALVRTANNRSASIDTILKPVYVNKNLQSLALDQIVYPGKLPLELLMAYGENGTTIDLTKKRRSDGTLDWTAPSGRWTLYALFTGLHGKMVERAAPGGEGYAIDHFSREAVSNYFKKFDTAFKGHDLSYLRGFFNDSYEVDDARGQSNWTPGFLVEFKKRKGYALENELPALFGKDNADKNNRVLYDYRSVIDDLLLEHFTQAWKKWGASKGAIVRNQSHGSPANTLDLYSAVDIPETEGTDILRFKFATSAANVTGKKLVSSESATWLNEHFLSSWGNVKKAIDLYFLGGVNHIFYHGTAYSPKDAPWPGWLFYAAVHFQPVNPQWKDFGTLNEYITRTQSFLQDGRPDNDVLLYYPIVDRYAQPGKELLQHFDGMERNFTGTDFEHVSKWMLDKGYGFDFFSERQLQQFANSASKITTGGNQYQTILLPAITLINEEAINRLVQLAKNGATILVYKKLPADVPGWNDLEKRRALFRNLLAPLKFKTEGGIQKAIIGKGQFLMADDLEPLMSAAKVRKESMAEKGLQFFRRKNADGYTYFITNNSGKVYDGWLPLQVPAASVALFDAMNGRVGMAKYKKEQGAGNVYLQLQPFQSMIVRTYATVKKAAFFNYSKPAGKSSNIEGEWTVEFLNGGPVLPQKKAISQLSSWTEWGADDYKNFSGTARYSIDFTKPSVAANAYVLDLGRVNETAEVFLNGKKIGTLIGPGFQVTIPSSAFEKNNHLEIIVANLMANRISYMDRNDIPWKIFYNTNMPARKSENTKNGLFTAAGWKPFPSGLSGPVTLTPVSYE